MGVVTHPSGPQKYFTPRVTAAPGPPARRRPPAESTPRTCAPPPGLEPCAPEWATGRQKCRPAPAGTREHQNPPPWGGALGPAGGNGGSRDRKKATTRG